MARRRGRECRWCQRPIGWWRAWLYGACPVCLFRTTHGGTPGRREHWNRQ